VLGLGVGGLAIGAYAALESVAGMYGVTALGLAGTTAVVGVPVLAGTLLGGLAAAMAKRKDIAKYRKLAAENETLESNVRSVGVQDSEESESSPAPGAADAASASTDASTTSGASTTSDSDSTGASAWANWGANYDWVGLRDEATSKGSAWLASTPLLGGVLAAAGSKSSGPDAKLGQQKTPAEAPAEAPVEAPVVAMPSTEPAPSHSPSASQDQAAATSVADAVITGRAAASD